MELSKTTLRRVYIDVDIKDYKLGGIYMFQVDYKNDKSFSNIEFLFQQGIMEESEEASAVDIRQQFLEKMIEYVASPIETEFYAIDACMVMLRLVEPLKSVNNVAKKLFNDLAAKKSPHEWLSDCISMGRVMPFTDVDDVVEFNSSFKRRFKEKYHECADEIKLERKTHLFVRYDKPEGNPELSFRVTDKDLKLVEEIRLHGNIFDDIMTTKAYDIIRKYPEADIISDRTSIRIYTLFSNTQFFARNECERRIFSAESMLKGLGKKLVLDSQTAYADYIKNAEDLRFGRYEDVNVYSIHTMKLPLHFDESAWDKNFKNNQIWEETSDSEYVLIGNRNNNKKRKKDVINETENVFGKLTVAKNEERFTLRVVSIRVKRYLPEYAVLTLEVENRFYKSLNDKRRINELCSEIWCSKKRNDSYPDELSLQIRVGERLYSLTSFERKADSAEPGLSLMLTIGRAKKNSGSNRLVAESLFGKMYTYFDDGTEAGTEKQDDTAVDMMLIKGEALRQIERNIAYAIDPDGDGRGGKLRFSSRREISKLRNQYIFIANSFGYDEENGESDGLCRQVSRYCGTNELQERIEKKLELIYE